MAGRTSPSDNDQYNRIFIIGVGDCIAADIRKAFDQFGEITDVYIPRGKPSRENKSKFKLITSCIHSFFLVFLCPLTLISSLYIFSWNVVC